MKEEEYLSIPKNTYIKLKKLEFKIDCLVQGGVHEWEGYSEALKPYFKMLKDREESK